MRLLRRRSDHRYMPVAMPFLAAAADASRRLGHQYIGTEHVLLALAKDRGTRAADLLAERGLTPEEIQSAIIRIVGLGEGPPGRLDRDALATLGIDLDEVRRRVEDAFGPDALERTSSGCTPIAPRLKRSLEHAAAEAGEGAIEATHVLVGLASVEESVAAGILSSRGLTEHEIRATLLP